MKNVFICLCLTLVCVAGMPTSSFGQDSQPVAIVYTFDVPLNQNAALLDLLSQVLAVVRQHEPEIEVDVYGAIATGSTPNAMTVVGEYASAEAWGRALPKLLADPEYQRLTQEILALGGVEVVSRSLHSKLALP